MFLRASCLAFAMMPIYWYIYFLKRGERKSLRKARSGRGNRRTAPIFSVRADSVVRFNGVYSLVDSTRLVQSMRITRTPREEVTAFEMYGSTRHRGIECSESAVRRDPLAGKKKSQKSSGGGRDFCVAQGKRSRRSSASDRSLILKRGRSWSNIMSFYHNFYRDVREFWDRMLNVGKISRRKLFVGTKLSRKTIFPHCLLVTKLNRLLIILYLMSTFPSL